MFAHFFMTISRIVARARKFPHPVADYRLKSQVWSGCRSTALLAVAGQGAATLDPVKLEVEPLAEFGARGLVNSLPLLPRTRKPRTS